MLANVLHDVPIIIKQPADIVHYLPPEMVPPSVSCNIYYYDLLRLPAGLSRDAAWSINANCSGETRQGMPRINKITCGLYAQLSKHITLQAEQVGRLILSATTTTVTIKTYYTGLTPRYGTL